METDEVKALLRESITRLGKRAQFLRKVLEATDGRDVEDLIEADADELLEQGVREVLEQDQEEA